MLPASETPLPLPILLYVEDEILIQIMVTDALEAAGFAALVAANGSDALETVRTQTGIRGIITDINLGRGIDGWDVARLAREQLPAVPIVYVSGTNAHEWCSRGVPNSIMISKPFAPAEIIVAMSSLLTTVEAAARLALHGTRAV